jgi:hypothetical protein
MRCASCGTVGPAGATWCPKCYLPYVRADATAPALASTGKHRPSFEVTAPPKHHASSAMKLLGVGLATLTAFGIYLGVRHGMSCQTSAVHPRVNQIDTAVHQDLTVLQRLAPKAGSKGWTLADGAAVLAADTKMTKTLKGVELSDADRSAVNTYVTTVHQFDATLTAYMAADDDATHVVYLTAAGQLQASADKLSAALHTIPTTCT